MSHVLRTALVASSLVTLTLSTGCSPQAADTGEPSSDRPSSSSRALDADEQFSALEDRFDARLGVHAVDTGSGDTVGWREDERFAYASTIKALAVGALLDSKGVEVMQEEVAVEEADILEHAPVAETRAGQTMSLGEASEAALVVSDNTAANYVFDAIGGPHALDGQLEAIGDEVTVVERDEPDLNEAAPGDDRDTTTPAAAAGSLREYLLEDALDAEERAMLTDWMKSNQTGETLVQAGVPDTWQVADKSGGGHYGSRGDIAVVWPEEGEPIVIAVYSSREEQDADYDDRLIAQAAQVAVETLREDS